MGRTGGSWFNLLYSVGLLLSSIFLIIILGLEFGKGVLSIRFINVYVILGLIGIVGFAIIIVYDFYKKVRRPSIVSEALFIADDSPKRRLLNKFKLIIPLLFTLMIVLFQVGLKSEIIPVPMPYDVGEGMSVDAVLAEHSPITNVFWMSVYPGLFEEMTMFILVTLIVALLTLVWLLSGYKHAFSRPMPLLVNVPIASMIGAFFFAGAHKLSYGTQSALYFSAWLFEFLAQMMNQFTGLFTSWIPHMVHNGLIAAGLMVGISIGSYVLASISLFKNPWIKKHLEVKKAC